MLFRRLTEQNFYRKTDVKWESNDESVCSLVSPMFRVPASVSSILDPAERQMAKELEGKWKREIKPQWRRDTELLDTCSADRERERVKEEDTQADVEDEETGRGGQRQDSRELLTPFWWPFTSESLDSANTASALLFASPVTVWPTDFSHSFFFLQIHPTRSFPFCKSSSYLLDFSSYASQPPFPLFIRLPPNFSSGFLMAVW